MQEKATLNYCKQYVIFNPDGSQRAIFDDLHPIKAPDGGGDELYAVKLTRGKNYARWGIIDGQSEYVAPVKYLSIGDKILNLGKVNVIEVEQDTGLRNLVTLDGKEIFQQDYTSVICHGDVATCVLRKGRNCGLGDAETGKVIIRPQFHWLEITENHNLYYLFDHTHKMYKWGLVRADGEALYEPEFEYSPFMMRWSEYNLAVADGRFAVIGWDGQKLYEIQAPACQRVRRPDAVADNYAVNAFMFFIEDSDFKQGLAKLVIFEHGDDKGECAVHEYDNILQHGSISEARARQTRSLYDPEIQKLIRYDETL